MSWAERLLRAAVGGDAEAGPQVTRLPPAMARAVDALRRCAELAPAAGAEAELRQLLRTVETVGRRLEAALKGIVDPPTETIAAGDASPGQNHWARLVTALEQHRELRSELLEAAIALTEGHPPLSAQLHQLARAEEAVTEELRNLIARADPQAAD